MKPNFKLKLVQAKPDDKLAKAIAYLRSRNLYVLDKGSKQPSWGVPGTPKVGK